MSRNRFIFPDQLVMINECKGKCLKEGFDLTLQVVIHLLYSDSYQSNVPGICIFNTLKSTQQED